MVAFALIFGHLGMSVEDAVVDLRNFYWLEDMAQRDFTYVSVGRPSINGA